MKHGSPLSPVHPAPGLAGELLQSSSVEEAAAALLSALAAQHGGRLAVAVEGEAPPPAPDAAQLLFEGPSGRAWLHAAHGALPRFSRDEQGLIALAGRR